MVVQEHKDITYFKLLKTIVTIGIFGFGGGAAVIPLFHREIIEKYHWLDDDEFQDILSVSNALPGPIQTKLAGYIGYRLKGIFGMIMSLLAIILPSLLVMLLFYNTINQYRDLDWINGAISGVFPVVSTMMLMLTINFFNKSNKSLKLAKNIILILLSILSIIIYGLNPAILIIIILIAVFIPKIKDLYRFILIFGLTSLIFIMNYFELFHLIFSDQIQTQDLSNLPQLLKLTIAFFIPGIIGYGGGPGSLSLISYEVVNHFNLLSSTDFGLLVALQSALPGVTATKLAGTIGFQTAGLLGSVVSILAYVIPSMILIISLLNLLNKYKHTPVVQRLTSFVGPVVIVLLGKLTFDFFKHGINQLGWVITILFIIISFYLLKYKKTHPFILIIISMIFGGLLSILVELSN